MGAIARRLAAVAIALSAAAPARAESVGVRLEWRSQEGCIDEASLRERVRNQLSRNRIDDSGHVSVRGEAVRDGDRWRVHLAVIGADAAVVGERDLDVPGADCETLERHVELVVAMLVDSTLVEEAAQREPGPPTTTSARPAARDPETPGLLRGEGPDGPRDRSVPVAAGAAVEVGRLPQTPFGGTLEIGLVAGDWLVGGRGLWFDAGTARRGGGATEVSWRSIELHACRRWSGTRLGVDACAGIGPGWVSARGTGFVENRETRETAVDALASARLRVALTLGFAAHLRGDLRAAVLRPEVGFEAADGAFVELYVPGFLAGTMSVALARDFP